jgi:adenine-specific DNA-methyltransferase
MATGNSKTKWSGSIQHSHTDHVASSEVSLCYANKSSETEVFATKPANPILLWQGAASNNRLYHGDNLPILASLLKDSSIRGKVRLIYIDPPFATNSVFHSRSQVDAYHDLLVGSVFIEFIRKRLLILRELLADDGSIYVHLDENMAFYIKVIMDEIFMERNFRNWITRRKCSHKNYTKKRYGDISDYILFYTKSDQYVWNRPIEEWTTERANKEYAYIEETTGRRYKKVPIHAPGTRNGETGQAWRGVLPPPGKHWQYPPRVLDELDARGEIYWSPTGNPRRKIYLDNSPGIPVQDIWSDFRDTRNQNVLSTGYPTEKNPAILERIVKASSNAGDLVLDCFSGSGTTLAVASQLGRKWIGIDNSMEAIRTTLRRFSYGVERHGDYVNTNKKARTSEETQSSMLDIISVEQTKVLQQSQPIRDFALFTTTEDQEFGQEWLKEWGYEPHANTDLLLPD